MIVKLFDILDHGQLSTITHALAGLRGDRRHPPHHRRRIRYFFRMVSGRRRQAQGTHAAPQRHRVRVKSSRKELRRLLVVQGSNTALSRPNYIYQNSDVLMLI